MGFYIDGRASYSITSIVSGKCKSGEYTFLDLKNKSSDSKYVERLKIKVWGKDITNEFSVGDRVAILDSYYVSLQKWQAKPDSEKVYYDLCAFCEADDIVKKADEKIEQSAELPEPAKKSARDVDIATLQDDDDDEPLPF